AAKERDKFMKYLAENGVGSGVYYSSVIYKQPFYKQLGYKSGICKEAEKAAEEVVSLPVHPLLSKANIDKVVKVVKGYKNEHKNSCNRGGFLRTTPCKNFKPAS
ncbi:MAG: DegT/DnrJ/EryC1/StrS family aminotransferase, partial [Endomicrobium sp.]|nr:DegT/DnrJ/EryC1/StrS family aminotransferase [Endomicrobium sp.]